MSSNVFADFFQHSSCSSVSHTVSTILFLTLAMASCLTEKLKTLQKAPIQRQAPPSPPRVLLLLLSVTVTNLGIFASQKHLILFWILPHSTVYPTVGFFVYLQINIWLSLFERNTYTNIYIYFSQKEKITIYLYIVHLISSSLWFHIGRELVQEPSTSSLPFSVHLLPKKDRMADMTALEKNSLPTQQIWFCQQEEDFTSTAF